ncbi:SCR-like 9, putative [Fagus crenata]
MNKLAVFLMVSFVLVSSLLTLSQGQLKLCPEKMTTPGTCGNNGNYECFLDFLNTYGASAMPMKCSCQPASTPAQRLCQCLIVCRENNTNN